MPMMLAFEASFSPKEVGMHGPIAGFVDTLIQRDGECGSNTLPARVRVEG
jgi:hypothetical protein